LRFYQKQKTQSSFYLKMADDQNKREADAEAQATYKAMHPLLKV